MVYLLAVRQWKRLGHANSVDIGIILKQLEVKPEGQRSRGRPRVSCQKCNEIHQACRKVYGEWKIYVWTGMDGEDE